MATAEKVTDMNLNDLDPLASRLASASDELNAALETIQQKINAKHLGVEAFLDSSWDHVLRRTMTPDRENDDLRSAVYDELGYGKDDDGNWGLVVRHYEGTQQINQYEDWEDKAGAYLWTRSLLRAPRDVRADAIEKIPLLIDAIHAAAQALVDKVEKAKQIAQSLD